VARSLSLRQRDKHAKTATPRPARAPRVLALPELDRLIHERIRLGIVSALATNESLTFNDLKRILKTTDGNLSVHARKLEEAQYISCVSFSKAASRAPNTASLPRDAAPWPSISIKWKNGSAPPAKKKSRAAMLSPPRFP